MPPTEDTSTEAQIKRNVLLAKGELIQCLRIITTLHDGVRKMVVVSHTYGETPPYRIVLLGGGCKYSNDAEYDLLKLSARPAHGRMMQLERAQLGAQRTVKAQSARQGSKMNEPPAYDSEEKRSKRVSFLGDLFVKKNPAQQG